MKVFGDLARSLDTSLSKRRLWTAAAVLCLIAWDRRHRGFTEDDVVFIPALILSLFVTWGGKKFWFLWGIATAVFLLSIVRVAFILANK